jgi:GTP diphosphokinase / guanosine-3',5'-bis(diphosphate) 3'-diphosphatase
MLEKVINYTDKEREQIELAFREMLSTLEGSMDESDAVNIEKAYEIALEGHSHQRRKSGEPYIYHPIEVARICVVEIGLGPTAVICALLHDVVEDTPYTLDDVRNHFGEKVARIVDGLTKLDGAYDKSGSQAENFRKVISTLIEDVRVVLIKMADRLHNMRTLGSMPRHKQLKIAAETSYIYAPLAHRLGLYNIKTEYQDICMKIMEPEQYHAIARKLQSTKNDRNHYVDSFILPLRDKIDELGISYRIFGRPKSISSIHNKIKTKRVPFEEIYDLFAVRIVIDVPRDKEKMYCWQIYSIVTDVHTPIPERLKDWITTPKSNGYESLHTTVIGPQGRFVEVQIRSDRMDEVAEKGFAAHWKYKGLSKTGDVFDIWINSIREILEDSGQDANEFITDFKTNLFHDEVYVYTPKGDMKILPKGATALDFAFSIHTDVGYRCTAVKVNNKLVPMGYELQVGDQIEVITSKNQKPNESWLRMTVTGKAKSGIRKALNEERQRLAEFGKEILERKLRSLRLDYDQNIEFLLKHFGFKNKLEFFVAIFNEKVNLGILKTFEIEDHKLKYADTVELGSGNQEEVITAPRSKIAQDQDTILYINGEPGYQYDFTYATCCNPLIGDDIFAYVGTQGVKIHRTGCRNAENLMAHYGYRILKADWGLRMDTNFVANLQIVGIDDGPGVIERVSNKVSTSLGLNIKAFSIEGNEGFFEGKISIVVTSKAQMEAAISSIKNLQGITDVQRID